MSRSERLATARRAVAWRLAEQRTPPAQIARAVGVPLAQLEQTLLDAERELLAGARWGQR